MPVQQCIAMTDQSQVGEARRSALRLAEALPLAESRRGDAAIVATELASNLIRHATGGRLLIQTLQFARGSCLELLAIDNGPGMPDVSRCLQDGYSTAGTAGTGFGAVRRLSDEFDVYSGAGGTVVLSRMWGPAWSDALESAFAIGAISMPAPYEQVCGDGWRVAESRGVAAVMVADGLGHGPLAADAADRAAATFETDPFADLPQYFGRAHVALTGGRGAAIACAHLSAQGVRYAGVGNIAGSVAGGERSRGLPSQNGTVGVQMRTTVMVSACPWPANGVLVMHSDGVATRWTFESYAGLVARHPATVAGVLYRDFLRGRDDATVVVVSARAGR